MTIKCLVHGHKFKGPMGGILDRYIVCLVCGKRKDV